MESDIYIKSDVINENCVFSFDGIDNRLNKEPFDFAPILWEKKDIENCIVDQLTSKSNNNIFLTLESIISIIQQNTKEDFTSQKLSRQFYAQHYNFFEVKSSGNKKAIESVTTQLVNAFWDICYKDTHLLTLDKLFAIIMDLGLFAITVKKTYSREDISKWKLPDYKLVNIIALFFTVIEVFYDNDIKKMFQETPSGFKYQNNTYDNSADIQNLTEQIINPFKSYLKTDVALQIQNDIPKFIYSSILFTYLSTFPIIEVIVSRYSFHNFLYAKTFNALEDVINIYRLFRLIPIFTNKIFLSHFPVANHSFINISWFLHIMKDYNADISFFEDILLKTFSNEVTHAIDAKRASDNLHEILDALFQLYSLSTDNVNIHEKMKSISALCLLKAN